MKTSFRIPLLVGILFVAITVGVFSQNLIDGGNPGQILSLAQGWGSATLGTDGEGDLKITGRIDGTRYSIYFFGCDQKNQGCNSIMFRTAWSLDGVSYQHINEWNRTKRFGTAYLDNELDPVIELSVNLDYGVTTENLDDTFDFWRVVLEGFKEHLRSR